MRAVFDIFLRDLRARLRDRSAVLIGVVAPLALIIALSLIAGGTSPSTRPLGYVPAPSTTVTDQMLTSAVFPALVAQKTAEITTCLLYTSPSPRD